MRTTNTVLAFIDDETLVAVRDSMVDMVSDTNGRVAVHPDFADAMHEVLMEIESREEDE